MEIYNLKLPNGEEIEYINTSEDDMTDYLAEMGYDITKIDAFYTSYIDIKNRELAQTVEGHVISVTSVDAVGMLQVQAAFGLGVPSTEFSFENEARVTLEASSFAAFAGAFAVARSSIMAEKLANRASILLPTI